MSVHPGNNLTDLIPEHYKLSLLKTPRSIPLDANTERLKALRSNQRYFWLTNWLASIGHNLLKINSHFNNNQFDEELLEISPQSYIANLEAKLVWFIARSSTMTPFELVKLNYNFSNEEQEREIEGSKVNLLYKLAKIASRKSFDSIRRSNDKSSFNTHLMPIHQSNKLNTLIQYYQFNSRVYRRVLEFNARPNLDQKRILYDNIDLDPQISSVECLISNIYELDSVFDTLPQIVQRQIDIYDIIEFDLNWRKVALNRKKAIEMELLLANRKKSSRIEQREKKRSDDQMQQAQIQRELDDILMEESGQRRSARVKAADIADSTPAVTETREERLKRRRLELGDGNENDGFVTIAERDLENNREERFNDDEDDEEDEEDYVVHDDDEEEEEDEEETVKEEVVNEPETYKQDASSNNEHLQNSAGVNIVNNEGFISKVDHPNVITNSLVESTQQQQIQQPEISQPVYQQQMAVPYPPQQFYQQPQIIPQLVPQPVPQHQIQPQIPQQVPLQHLQPQIYHQPSLQTPQPPFQSYTTQTGENQHQHQQQN